MASNCHALPKNKKTETPNFMIFFDSESYVDPELQEADIEKALKEEEVEKEHETYLIVATYATKNKKGDFNEYTSDYHKNTAKDFKKQFWQDVDNYAKVKKKVYMFAHNAKYDLLTTGCLEYLVELGYRVESFSDSNPFFLLLNQKRCPECGSFNITQDEKLCDCEECGLMFESKHLRTKTIVVLSSTNYYQFSLAKLGECFNLQKGEVDYATVSLEDSIVYCRQDVFILRTAMMAFIKFLKDEDLGGFKMTVAGQSFSAYRHSFMEENSIFIHRDRNAILTERGAYAGGRNEVWKLGKTNEELYYVDVNSMYPHVMKQRKYPCKLKTFRRTASLSQVAAYIKQGYLICARVELDTKNRIYFKKADRLMFPSGNFETYLSTPEIKRALKDKEVKAFYDVCVYEARNIFSEYVDYFYNKRLESKAQDDEVRTLLYKLFLNSLYGKFGQKNNNWELIEPADPTEIKVYTLIRAGGKRSTVKVFGGGAFEKVELADGDGEAPNSFPAIAAHVTAYARMLLWGFIETAGEDNVYYMDTDSLFVNKEGYENLKKSGVLDDKELGKLKLEHKIYDVDIRGCKDYKFKFEKEKGGIKKEVQEDKIKGVNKRSVKIDENTFVSTVWGGLAQYIKDGKLNGYKNSVIVKELSRKYTKGIIGEDGVVTPFVYNKNLNVIVQDNLKDIEETKCKIEMLNDMQKIEGSKVKEIIIKECKGIKGEGNGAYKEEIQNRFKPPIKNFKNGMVIDRAVWFVNERLNTEYTANELMDILEEKSLIKKEIKELNIKLKELKSKKEYRDG